jgi:uncharacterized protein (TIGR02147 family)
VYDYDDFRAFLQDAYEEMKSRNPKISYRWLQKKAGYTVNSNHFWQKLTGRSPMSQDAAEKYGRAIGLTEREISFFQLLVRFNQAKDDTQRAQCVEKLNQFPRFRRPSNLARINSDFYSDWFLPALRALVTLDDFFEDYEWMAARMLPPITARQAKAGIKKLIDIGMLERDSKRKLVQCEPFIGQYNDRTESSDVSKLMVRNYHRAMLQLAAESLEGQPQSKRYVIGNTLGISHNQAKKLRKICEQFMYEVERIAAEDEPIETVYRLNIQLFALTNDDNEKKE